MKKINMSLALVCLVFLTTSAFADAKGGLR